MLRPEDQTEAGVYQGTLSLSAYAQEGTYVLTKATLRSANGDYRYYCLEEDLPNDPDENRKELPQLIQVKLENGVKQNDETAPTAEECILSQTEVLAETALTLTIPVTETGSGVDYVKARFLGDNGRGISVTLKYVDGIYVGYLSASQLKHPGTYALQRVMLKDLAGNRAVCTNYKDVSA